MVSLVDYRIDEQDEDMDLRLSRRNNVLSGQVQESYGLLVRVLQTSKKKRL